MIHKMKICCGEYYTEGLEGIFNDLANAEEYRRGFQQYLHDKNIRGLVETNVC